jgi:hypothetical protein
MIACPLPRVIRPRQASLKEVNRSSVLISLSISARVLGWTKRMAISQMTL